MSASAKVDRLTVEAGKFLGKVAGDTIDRGEVFKQAQANGYTDREARDMLEGRGDTLTILDQGNLFGELWPGNQSLESNPQLPNPLNTVEQFKTWLDQRRSKAHPYPLQHNWSHRKARKNFARAKDVDRYYWQNYDKFTTVLVTRTADENTEPLARQTESLTPRAYYQARYRLLKRLSDDYSALSVIAPKFDLPMAEKTVRSHVHEGYWIPGHHSADSFDLLKDKHMATVPGATGAHLTVEHHSRDTYPCRRKRFGKDAARGATTSLPYELAGENQPLMAAETDAGDLPDPRTVEWCARLSAGSDGSHSTPGKSYWIELGGFRESADSQRYISRLRDGRFNAQAIRESVGLSPTWTLKGSPTPGVDVHQTVIHAVAQLAQVAV